MSENRTRERGTKADRSCDFCKRRHLKCNGDWPCPNCSQRGQDCVYSQRTKRKKRAEGEIDEETVMPITGHDSAIENEKTITKMASVSTSKFLFNSLVEWVASSLPDLSLEESSNYLQIFREHVAPAFPFFQMKHQYPTFSSLSEMLDSDEQALVDAMISCLECIVICLNAAAVSKDGTALKFADAAQMFLQVLFMLPTIRTNPQFASRLADCLMLLGYYFYGNDQLEKNRMYAWMAFNLLSGKATNMSSGLMQRLYSFISGGFRTVQERLDFIQKAKQISSQADSQTNLCFVVHTLASLFFSTEDLRQLYNELELFFNDVVAQAGNSGEMTPEFKFMVLACRARIYDATGRREQALQFAQAALDASDQVKSSYLGIALCNAFALNVINVEAGTPHGIAFERFAELYPTVAKLHTLLPTSPLLNPHSLFFEQVPMLELPFDY